MDSGIGKGARRKKHILKYGDADRKIVIEALWKTGTVDRVGISELPAGVSVIEGGFAYEVKD